MQRYRIFVKAPRDHGVFPLPWSVPLVRERLQVLAGVATDLILISIKTASTGA